MSPDAAAGGPGGPPATRRGFWDRVDDVEWDVYAANVTHPHWLQAIFLAGLLLFGLVVFGPFGTVVMVLYFAPFLLLQLVFIRALREYLDEILYVPMFRGAGRGIPIDQLWLLFRRRSEPEAERLRLVARHRFFTYYVAGPFLWFGVFVLLGWLYDVFIRST